MTRRNDNSQKQASIYTLYKHCLMGTSIAHRLVNVLHFTLLCCRYEELQGKTWTRLRWYPDLFQRKEAHKNKQTWQKSKKMSMSICSPVNEQQNNHPFSDSNKNQIVWLCSSQKHKQNLTALVNCKAHPQHKYLPIQKCHFVPK